MSTYIIYKTTCLVNNKIYVGKHQQETSGFDGYFGSGIILVNSILKHGKENFIRETLELCTSANVNEREIFWISELNATNLQIGLNLTSGGEGGHVWVGDHPSKGKTGKLSPFFGKHHSEETKFKISQKHMGKGHPMTEENKIKLREINTGKIISEEQKIKQSLAMSGENHPNWGKKRKLETKLKIKESCQKKNEHHKNKYVFILSNNQNYWEFFTKNERCNLNAKFREKKTNTITFKGINIQRIQK